MNSKKFQQLLLENTRLIQALQTELEETNKGVIQLIMELEETKCPSESEHSIIQLQKELEETNKGLLALAAELDQSEEKYRNIFENAVEGIFTFTEIGTIETINPAALSLFGYEENELTGMDIGLLIPALKDINGIINNGQAINKKYNNDDVFFGCHKNKSMFPIEFTFGKSIYQNERLWMIIVRDITERKKTEESIRITAKIFECSNDGIIITNNQGNVIDVNRAFTIITGYKKEEVIANNMDIFKSGKHDKVLARKISKALRDKGSWSGEVMDRRKNGESYPKWLSNYSVKNDHNDITHYVTIFTDITSRKEAENKLKQLAHYDTLTGLPNRTHFIERLKWTIDVAKRNNKQAALMFLDLDRFKVINDTLGHHAGDQLLVEIARRLEKCVRGMDTVSRLAGDEFTVILTSINNPEEATLVAKKILHALSFPVCLEARNIFISTSIGITIFPVDGKSSNQLIRNADTAMYHAKELGRNNYQFFSAFMNQKVLDELEMETNLRNALKNGEFLLHYQPKIDLTTNKIIGVEVLIRWKHPELGFISPSKFIPHAEKTDLIIAVGDWVLHTACKQSVQWQVDGIPPIRISVNLSGMQLKRNDQVENVARILAETGLPPNLLELELTEGVVMENAEATISTLNKFKEMGIKLSIDDFGTGYSSLSYLKRFPIDTLKIDQSFVKDITTNPDDEAIASTIIAMAHNLRLKVIAEGVENKEQLDMLRNKDCDEVQGYYFSRPVSEEDLKELLCTSVLCPNLNGQKMKCIP